MTLPVPESALASHIAILGKTGSGKSNLAKIIVESLLDDGERVCVIDPTGTWYGLRLAKDGKRASPYGVVIFGGAHADLPIGKNHGAAVAETIGTTSSPAIVDTRMMTVGERTTFFADFGESLLRKNRGPLHLIVDESHLFIPQGRVADPQSGRMLHAGNNLVSLGRGNGLRIILISQRPAKLHKDSLSQVETLVAMRLIAPQDRRAVDDWIGEWADPQIGKDLIASLPSLATGEGWVWAPEIGVLERKTFPVCRTFDSGKAPIADETGPVLAPIDIEAIASKLETIANDAFDNDPARLKKQIAELQRELGRKESQPDKQVIKDAERRGFNHGMSTAEALLIDRLEQYADSLAELCDIANPLHDQLLNDCETMRGRQKRSGGPEETSVNQIPEKSISGQPASITKPLKRIIDAIRWWNVLGVTTPSQSQVAFIAGYSHKSGTWSTYLSRLRSERLIDGRGTLILTPAGASLSTEPDGVPSGEHLRERVLEKISGPLARILRPILDAYPDTLAQADAADRSGYSANSGTWSTYLSRLRSLDLIEGRGALRAQDWLFP